MILGDLDIDAGVSFDVGGGGSASAGASAPSPGGSGPPPVTATAALTPSPGSPQLTLSRRQMTSKLAGREGVLRGGALSVSSRYAGESYLQPTAFSTTSTSAKAPILSGGFGKFLAGLAGIVVVAGVVYWVRK